MQRKRPATDEGVADAGIILPAQVRVRPIHAILYRPISAGGASKGDKEGSGDAGRAREWSRRIDETEGIVSKPDHRLHHLIALQATASCLMVAVVVFDHAFDVPCRIFGYAPCPTRWQEMAIEAGAILLFAAASLYGALRMVRTIRHLESLLVMCAWCRKVKVEGEWVSFERYLVETRDVATSHGICPACKEKFPRMKA